MYVVGSDKHAIDPFIIIVVVVTYRPIAIVDYLVVLLSFRFFCHLFFLVTVDNLQDIVSVLAMSNNMNI